MKKRIIWSNVNLEISEDWRDGYREFLEINNLDGDPNDDDELYEWICDMNYRYLDDERMNLDKIVDGRILVIADLGLWNGRVTGYDIIESRNIKDILYAKAELGEWYSDGYNIRSKQYHHDGTNYLEYRIIREDRNIDNLLDDIYNQKLITRKKLNYYTKSLHPAVAKVYGW